MPEERLQKLLARAGVASRRAAEDLIQAGRVKVNGRVVTELGTRVDTRGARIELDGRRVMAEPLVYIVLNKPRGVMCTLRDPEGRPTIADYLQNVGVRVVPVGRLDFHTSGALLCTSDGEFANALQHPRSNVPKVYVAKVRGDVTEADLKRWSQSIEIDGRNTQPAEVRKLRLEGDKTWLTITLREGRNRQVRRLGDATGFPVMRLSRVEHAGINTEGLRPGQWRHLTPDELADLKQAYGVPKRVRAASRPVPTRAPRPAPVRPQGKRAEPARAEERKTDARRTERRSTTERKASPDRQNRGREPRGTQQAVSRGGARASARRRGT